MMSRESATTGIQLPDEVTPLPFNHLLPIGVVLGGGDVVFNWGIRRSKGAESFMYICDLFGRGPEWECSMFKWGGKNKRGK